MLCHASIESIEFLLEDPPVNSSPAIITAGKYYYTYYDAVMPGLSRVVSGSQPTMSSLLCPLPSNLFGQSRMGYVCSYTYTLSDKESVLL